MEETDKLRRKNNILVTILVFGFLILAHEAGHFFMAKLFKVKVNEFAIGMGPAILKKQGKSTLYSISTDIWTQRTTRQVTGKRINIIIHV